MLFFKLNWSPLFFVVVVFFISGSRLFSFIHANVDFKIKSKERISFVVVVFLISKSPGGDAIFCRNASVL